MLTRSGWALLAGSVAVVVAARLLGLVELYVLGASGLGLVAIALQRTARAAPALTVTREVHPHRVHLGGPCRIDLRVANLGRRTTPVLVLHDPVTGTGGARLGLSPLAPGEQRTLNYPLPTARRGLVDLGPLEAVVADPFGLSVRRRPTAGRATVTVLPAVEPLRGPVTGGGLDDPLAGVSRPIVGAAGDDEFASLRPYVVGDDLRRVHWPTTARTGDLVVRQDDPPWTGNLTVVLDARATTTDPDRFESAVSAAASLLNAVAGEGERVRLVVTDGRPDGLVDSGLVDARTGQEALLEQLALVEPGPGSMLALPPSRRPGRTGGLVVITGTPSAEDVAAVEAQRGWYRAVRLVVVADGPGPAAASVPVIAFDGRRTSFATAWAVANHPAGARR